MMQQTSTEGDELKSTGITLKMYDTVHLMRTPPPPLLPLLRSQTQGELLALLCLHPNQSYSLSEAARILDATPRAIQYEASRLVEAGLILDERRANCRFIRAAGDSPIMQALSDLLAVTYGPVPVLTDLLSGVPGIVDAYIYGSWAARFNGEPGAAPHDVDVLVIGDIDLDTLDGIAREAQGTVRIPVNIRRVSSATWTDENLLNPFILSIRERPQVHLDLAAGTAASRG